jgi:hypothetical protein
MSLSPYPVLHRYSTHASNPIAPLRRRDDRLPERQTAVVGRHLAVRQHAKPCFAKARYNLLEQDAVLEHATR